MFLEDIVCKNYLNFLLRLFSKNEAPTTDLEDASEDNSDEVRLYTYLVDLLLMSVINYIHGDISSGCIPFSPDVHVAITVTSMLNSFDFPQISAHLNN